METLKKCNISPVLDPDQAILHDCLFLLFLGKACPDPRREEPSVMLAIEKAPIPYRLTVLLLVLSASFALFWSIAAMQAQELVKPVTTDVSGCLG